jgi:DNA-binding NarL/FixJ family response regulator
MKNALITVLVADDHVMVRDIFCRLLERAGDIQVVATAANGDDALRLAILHRPNLALLAVNMPLMNGINAAKQIRERCPDTRVLMVSGYDTSEYIRRAIEAGASGYVLKDSASQDLAAAVHSLYEGKPYFSQQIADIAKRYWHQHKSG